MVKESVQKDISELKIMMKKVLANQQALLKEEALILEEEKELEEEEREVQKEEKEQLSEMEELEKLEKEIKEDIKASPLSKVTGKDFAKALIGAFFGVVGHFAFFYGIKISEFEHFTVARASILYITSLVLAFLFMYFAGFRKVDKKAWKFIPFRVLTIYMTSIAVIVFVLFIFGFIAHGAGFEHIFKAVSTISIMAVLGASAADLIGKE